MSIDHAERTGREQRSRIGGAAVLAVLLLLTVLFFGRVLFTGQALYWSDIPLAFYPAHDLWRQYALEHRLALWNPLVFGGMPMMADAQFSTLYPSMALNLFLPLHTALAIDLAIHIFLLGALTYAFLRREGLSVIPALLGAVAFGFSGFAAARVIQPSVIRTLAWTPLLLLVVGGAGGRWQIRAAARVALVLSVMVMAGHLQTVFISVLLAAAYATWRTIGIAGSRTGPRGSLAWLAAVFCAGGFLALLLTAVQVLPAAEMVASSERSGGTSFEFATSFSLPWRQILMLIAPDLFGNLGDGFYWGGWLYWEMVGYGGVVTLLLALLGLGVSRRPGRFFWGGIAFCGVVMALGDGSPVYRLAYWLVPGLAYFRVPARFLLWYAFGLSVLAAFGAQWLLSSPLAPRRLLAAVLVVAGTAVTAYWALGAPGVVPLAERLTDGVLGSARFLSDSYKAEAAGQAGAAAVEQGQRVALLWISAGLVVVLACYRRLRPAVAGGMLVLLVSVDLLSYGIGLYPTVKAADLRSPVPVESALDMEGGRYRILTTPAFVGRTWIPSMTFRNALRTPEDLLRFRNTLLPNIGVHSRIANAGGYSPVLLARVGQYFSLAVRQAEANQGRSAMLDFMGARYIFTYADLSGTYEKAYHDRFFVWFNSRALPRGYIATRFVVQPDDGAVARMLVGGWDPRETVILDRAPEGPPALRMCGEAGRVLRRKYGMTRLSFDLALDCPGIFVLSDAYYPGWRAYVDGVETPIYRANHAFRAVFLPAQARHVEFVFRPVSVVVGAWISGTTWVVVLAALVLDSSRRRKGTTQAPQVRISGEVRQWQ